MTRDFDPTPEERDVVLIDAAAVRQAQRMLTGCEACVEDPGDIFASVLDVVTGCDPAVTDYVLEFPTRCLQCGTEINENTLIEWDLDRINDVGSNH